jgi:hypothetical protein
MRDSQNRIEQVEQSHLFDPSGDFCALTRPRRVSETRSARRSLSLPGGAETLGYPAILPANPRPPTHLRQLVYAESPAYLVADS